MNSKLSIVFIAIFILTLGFVFLPAKAQDEATDAPTAKEATTKWQHLALTHDAREFGGATQLARQINKLGEEGWEMFNVLNFQQDGTTTKTIYHFKRPL